MKTSSLSPLLTLTLALLATATSARAQLINPGFETSTLSGWAASSGANVSVVGTVTDFPIDPFTLMDDLSRPYVVTPFAGSFQARLVAGTTPLASLETFLNLSAGSLSTPINNPFGLADGAALRQTAMLNAGDIVRLHWNFLNVDTFNDFAFASISGPGVANFSVLTSVSALGANLGSGWQTLTFVAPTTGSYLVGFGVANAEDNTVGSILFADVGFAPVPESSTYGILAALLLAGTIIHRRFRTSSVTPRC